ncbi:hypothetical protein ACVBAX_24555 [Robertmurraya sp. GLU-23]
MSAGNYHAQCNKYRGRAVEIRTNYGRTNKGIIQHVSRNKVYLHPLNDHETLVDLVMVVIEVMADIEDIVGIEDTVMVAGV